MSENYGDKPKLGGTVFLNRNKTAENHPTHTGIIEVEKKFLKALVDTAKKGDKVEIQIAQWDRPEKANPSKVHRYTSIEEFERKQKPVEDVEIEDLPDDDGIPF
jgi:predicted RNA-binding protein with RPS1 domain